MSGWEPLIMPRTQVRHVRHHSLCNSRWAKLERLAGEANVRRPGAGATPAKPSIGALLEALATGQIGIVRMDDPERRVLVVKTRRAVPCVAAPQPDPRCPGDWDQD
jgi:hypothetical protein